jgi:hypothetical protein
VSSATAVVAWSTPDQDAYQLRTVADDGGSPDTGTVYTDTGTVESPSARSRSVTFPTTGRFEHVQLRVRNDGLWSPYRSNRFEVSYTPPAVPTIDTLTGDPPGATITVAWTHPAPTGSQPTVVQTRIERDPPLPTADGTADVVAAGPFVDRTVGSGVEHAYRVVAVASNSTETASTWSS